jgi:hypothetical protein
MHQVLVHLLQSGTSQATRDPALFTQPTTLEAAVVNAHRELLHHMILVVVIRLLIAF